MRRPAVGFYAIHRYYGGYRSDGVGPGKGGPPRRRQTTGAAPRRRAQSGAIFSGGAIRPGSGGAGLNRLTLPAFPVGGGDGGAKFPGLALGTRRPSGPSPLLPKFRASFHASRVFLKTPARRRGGVKAGAFPPAPCISQRRRTESTRRRRPGQAPAVLEGARILFPFLANAACFFVPFSGGDGGRMEDSGTGSCRQCFGIIEKNDIS